MVSISKKSQSDSHTEEVPGKNASQLKMLNGNGSGEHFVSFYESSAFLVDAVSKFIGAGLSSGDGCILLVTQPHMQSIEEQLRAGGLDLAHFASRGEYIALDVDEMLPRFMVDRQPEPERFFEVIGEIIRAAAKGQRPVRIFGEMVAVLWTQGNQDAARRLEELWNDLAKNHTFSLFCAYPLNGFSGDEHTEGFAEICHLHTRAIPAESYTTLENTDERMLAITVLQQKAASLEAEIAEHKETEARLRASEERYRLLYEANQREVIEQKKLEAKFRRLFESNLVGVFISDFSGTFLDANDAFLNLLGYTRAELLAGCLDRDALTPPEYHYLSQNAVEAMRETGASGTYEKEYLHKSGKRIPVLVAVSRIGRTDTCVGFALDISERKELERRKDEFISMASHELKTPLTSLKGFLNLLQRRLAAHGDEQTLHYAVRMESQVDKLTKLIGDLLDISKMRAGQLSYREERFDIDTLVQEIVESMQETTRTHRLLLEGQAHTEVFGDRDRVGQVLINLLNNAIKYSARADRVLVRVANDGDRVIISIQDFGIGIAEEHLQKIFERFYQVTDPVEKTYPGLGIGLYIACQIIKRHGGELWVESKKGEGSTFQFTLPLSRGE